jgi:general secretion pathway protein C
MFAGTAAAAAPPPAPASSGGATVADDIKKGIERIGPREFNVDRGVIDKILENQALLMRQVRIEPEEGSGKVVGLKVLGVKPDSLLGVLGMENGDRLERINGFDITSPQSALEAYGRLPAANHLRVLLNRKGSEVNVDYDIR